MHYRKILIFALLFFLPLSSVSAKDAAHQTNGCGPQGFSILVPNKTILSNCKFRKACDEHDICYGRCLKGGDLFGSPDCHNEAKRKIRKAICDKKIRVAIHKYNSSRMICKLYASIYHFAVSIGGDGSFKGAESVADKNIVEFKYFLKYVDDNPNSFDIADVDAAFEKLMNLKISSNNKVSVTFLKWEPSLIINGWRDEKLIRLMKLNGNKPNKK